MHASSRRATRYAIIIPSQSTQACIDIISWTYRQSLLDISSPRLTSQLSDHGGKLIQIGEATVCSTGRHRGPRIRVDPVCKCPVYGPKAIVFPSKVQSVFRPILVREGKGLVLTVSRVERVNDAESLIDFLDAGCS